jgi:hypothetical protein
MPIPERKKEESKKDFISRCMSDSVMIDEYKNTDQRYSICLSKSKGSILEDACYYLNEDELLTVSNLIVPLESEYIDFGEEEEDYDIIKLISGKYEYRDPVTFEIFYYDRPGNYKRNNRYLRFIGRAAGSEYQGRKVTLNKPFRTPDGPKKFSVYVKNEKGNVVKVNFGDPNMKIKKNIPERRKSFRARHKCDSPGPKWKARYWSCKAW